MHTNPTPQDVMATIRSALLSARAEKNILRTKEEKTKFITDILSQSDYDRLPRADKGLVRQYLIRETGYSRAQVERYIAAFGARTIMSAKAMAAVVPAMGAKQSGLEHAVSALGVIASLNVRTLRRSLTHVHRRHVVLGVATVACVLFVSFVRQFSSASLVFLTGEQESAGSWNLVQNQADAPIVSFVSPVFSGANARIQARKEARILQWLGRTEEMIRGSAHSGPTVENSVTVASALNLDWLRGGKDGQVLVYKNGKPQWVYLPNSAKLDGSGTQNQGVQSTYPRSSDEIPERRGGGGGGSGNASGGGTTTIIQQVPAGAPEDHTHEGSGAGGLISILAATTGTLTSGRGGTGFSSYATGDILVGSGTTLARLSLGATNTVLTSSGGRAMWTSAGAIAAAGGWVDDGTTIRLIGSSDLVGVGTSTPGSKLSVSGSMVIGFNIGSIAADAGLSLEILGTASGDVLHAQRLLRSSGSLVVSSTGMFGGNLTTRGNLSGASLTISNLAGCASLQANSAGALSCGGSTFGSGNVITLTSRRYVDAAGDTITGALVIRGSLSGSTIYASTSIATSGSLVVKSTGLFQGNLTTRGTLSGASLTVSSLNSCQVLQTSSNGALSCGGGFLATSTGALRTAFQSGFDSRYVNVAGDTMTGSLAVRGTISGSALTVMNGTSYFMGSVGIGTASPQTGLHISGANATTSALRLQNTAASTLEISSDSTGGYIQNSTANKGIRFIVNAGATNGMSIDGSGYVGIGATPSSAGILSVLQDSSAYNASAFNAATLRLTASNTDSDYSGIGFASTAASREAFLGVVQTGSAAGDLVYQTYNASAYGERLRVTNAGLVGIGTNNPRAKLSVTGSGYFSAGLGVNGTISGSALTVMNGQSYILGNVAIGKTGTPTAKVDVVGTISGTTLVASGLANCNTLNTVKVNAAGQLYCATDEGGGGSSSKWTDNGAITYLTATSDDVAIGGSDASAPFYFSASTGLLTVNSLSGSTVIAKQQLRSSGSLAVDGSVYFKSLVSCQALRTASNGALSCANGLLATSTGALRTAFQSGFDNRYVNTSGDTMTGALVIQNGTVHTPTATALLNVRGTISGALLTLGTGTASAPSLTFNNDTNTGLYWISADTLGFSTGGSERMRIDSSGRVGIGTTNTSTAKLNVAGTISGASLVVSSGANLRGPVASELGFDQLNEGLVGYWPFAESGSSVAYDRSKYANNGALTNGPTWVGGKIGSALSFDGINDYVTGPAPNITGSFTLSTWIKRTSNAVYTRFGVVDVGNYSFNNGFGIWMGVGGDNVLTFRINNSYGELPTFTPALDTWEYITFVYNGSTISSYRNGILQSSSNFSTNPNPASTVTLGTRSDGISPNFYGVSALLDDVRIYNRALSVSEIRGIYNKAPDTNFFTAGSLSGASLTVNNLVSCSALQTSSAGALSCAGGLLATSTGALRTAFQSGFDNRYVNTSGDTMTGALVIQNGTVHTPTATALLNVRGTISGSALVVNGTSRFNSGAVLTLLNPGNVGLIIKAAPSQTSDLQQWKNSSGNRMAYVASDGSMNIGSADGVAGTLNVRASNGGAFSITMPSGFGPTITTYSSINWSNAGTAGWVNDGTTTLFGQSSTQKWRASTTQATTVPWTVLGTTSQSANLQEWQNSSSTVLSAITQSGWLAIGKSTAITKLDVVGTISGSALTISSLPNCTGLQTSTNGSFSCGTGASSVLTQSSADARFVNVAGDTMTGALVIQNGTVHTPTATALLNVRGTISGALLTLGTGTASAPSLTFNNDTNTGLYWIGTDTLGITTGGVERMRIDASGNVGIGTTNTSAAKLNVAGTISGTSLTLNNTATYSTPQLKVVSSSAAKKTAAIGFYKGSTLLYTMGTDFNENDTSDFWIYDPVAAANRFYINSSGNVAVGGAVVATYKWNVLSAGALGEYISTSNSDAGNPQVNLIDASRGVNNVISSYDGTTAGMYIATYDGKPLMLGAGGTKVTVLSSGNVGIGTSSPTVRLHVIGSGAFTGTNARVSIGKATATTSLDVVGTISGSALTIMRGNSYLLGNVGIGTSNTSVAKLNVAGRMSGASLVVSSGANLRGPIASELGYDPLNEGLIGYWPFAESGSTVVYDRSKNAKNGTLVGGPVWVSGKMGSALSFDGTDDYVQTSLSPANLTAVTMSAWVNLTSAGNYPMVISMGTNTNSSLELNFLSNTGQIQCIRRSDNQGVVDTVNLVGTGWHHVLCASNGTTFWLYRDGVLIGSSSLSHSISSSPEFRIGTRADGVSNVFTGLIDEVRIYNRVLSQSEIRGIYNKAPDTNFFTAGSLSGASLTVSNLVACEALQTSSAGALSCANSLTRAGLDARYVNTAGDTMTGALRINWRGTSSGGVLLNVNGTMSGRHLTISGTGTSPILKTSDNRVDINGTLENGLIGWWAMDKLMSADDVEDLSVNDNSGALLNGPTFTTGRFGKALNFDGTNDSVSVTSIGPVDTVSRMTVSHWLKPTVNGFSVFSAKSNAAGTTGWLFQTISEDNTNILFYDGSTGSKASTTSNLFTPGSWHHVVSVFDGSQVGNANRIKIFIDGVQQSLSFLGTFPATISSASEPFRIGVWEGGTAYFNGSIDDVRIYNRALSPREVAELYRYNPLGDGGTILTTLKIESGANLLVSGTISGSLVRIGAGSVSAPSLSFNNDTNTGLYWIGADTLGIATGGIERLRITASGSVGIGISTPRVRLAVSGSTIIGRNIGANRTTQYDLEVLGSIAASGAIRDALGWIQNQGGVEKLKTGLNNGSFGAGATPGMMMSGSSVSVYDTTNVHSNSKGFAGAVFDGRYLYLTPYNTGTAGNGQVTRYDTTMPLTNASSYRVFDMASVNSSAKGFQGGVFDGRYVYYVPFNDGSSYHGKVARYDTLQSFTASGAYTFFDTTTVNSNSKGFVGGVFDGRYLYLVPFSNGSAFGQITRLDTQANFTSASAWSVFNTTSVDSNSKGFGGGVFDGRYIYLIPYTNGSMFGQITRYDTTLPFGSAGSYSVFDTAAVNANSKGFVGAAFDGRYIYMVPYNNGTSGQITRLDTTGTFTSSSSYAFFDMATVNANAKGYQGAVFDGRYVYFSPNYNGSAFSGLVARYDTAQSFTSSSAYTFIDTTLQNANSRGFVGAAFDGRNVYFIPYENDAKFGQITRIPGWAGGTDTPVSLPKLARTQELYILSNGNVGLGTTSPGSRLSVSGALIVGSNIGSKAAKSGVVIEALGTISGSILTMNNPNGSNYFMGKVGIGNTAPANKFSLGIPTTADSLADGLIGISAATQKGLVIQSASSQTADPFQVQGSDGTVKAKISANGTITAGAGGFALARTDQSGAAAHATITLNTNNQMTLTNVLGNTFILDGASDPVYLSSALGASLGNSLRLGYGYNPAIMIQDNSIAALTVLNTSGNVGIGRNVDSPGSILSVSGAVTIGNNIGSRTAKAQLDVVGTISGSALVVNGTAAISGKLTASGGISGQYAKVLVVDGNGKADHLTITAAYAAAKNLSPSSSNRILIRVLPGEYNERITLDTNYISLEGAGYETTVVYSAVANSTTGVITSNFSGSGVIVSGLTFDNRNTSGAHGAAYVYALGNPIFQNNKFTCTACLTGNGGDMYNVAAGTYQNNLITGDGYVSTVSGGKWLNNTFTGQVSTITGGLWQGNIFRPVGPVALSTVSGGIFEGNTFTPLGGGSYTFTSISGGTFTNNYIGNSLSGAMYSISGGTFNNNYIASFTLITGGTYINNHVPGGGTIGSGTFINNTFDGGLTVSGGATFIGGRIQNLQAGYGISVSGATYTVNLRDVYIYGGAGYSINAPNAGSTVNMSNVVLAQSFIGSANYIGDYRIESSASPRSTILQNGAGAGLVIQQKGAGNILVLQDSTRDRLTITAAGNLGIGTSSPGSPLSVSGAVTIGNNIGSRTAKAQLDVVGTISGSSLTVSGLSACEALQTSSAGALSCANSLTRAGLDARYVNIAGDTMTGALRINWRGTSSGGVLLNVNGTMSGRALHISGTGATPLIATNNPTGTIMMGRTSMVTGSGMMAPQLYIAGRVPTTFVGSGSTGTNPYDIAVQGNYAYITNYGSDKLQIWDITTPSKPTLKSSITTNTGPLSVAVVGRYAYVGTAGFIGSANRFEIYDISNAASPTLVSSTSGNYTPYDIAVQGNYAYVKGFGIGDIYAWDISNPAAPRLMSSVSVPGLFIAVQGKYLYSTDLYNHRIRIYDISNPANMVLMSNIASATQYPDYLAVQGKYLYVSSDTNSYIHVYDVSNPVSPSFVSSYSAGGATTALVAQSRYLYAAVAGSNQMQVIDISNPSSLSLVGASTSGTYPTGIAVQGRYAYIINYSNHSLGIYDVGGSYIQQLEAGGIQANSLMLQGALSAMDGEFRGGLTIGRGFQAQGPSSITQTATGASAYGLTIQSSTGALRLIARGTKSAPHIQFGTGSTFDTVLYRSAASTLKTMGNFHVVGTMSGKSLRVTSGLFAGSGSAMVPLTVRGAVSQSANLQEWQDSTAAVVAAIAPSGRLGLGTSPSATANQWINMPNSYIYQDASEIDIRHNGLFVVANQANTIYPFIVSSAAAPTARVTVTTFAAATKGLVIVGNSGQTGNLQEWQNSSGTPVALIDANGGMGVGSGTGLIGKQTIYTADSFNNPALFIRTNETTAEQNLIKIVSDVSTTGNTVFRVQADGATYSDNAYNSSGADYAEWFYDSGHGSSAPLRPGELVCIDVTKNNSVKRCERDSDANAMGIVSTNPAFIGNSRGGVVDALGIPLPGYVLVGLIGQVPGKVMIESGAVIRAGDSLTPASVAGYARKANAGESTVGVALEAFSGAEGAKGTINVLISRRNQSLTVEAVEQRTLEAIRNMKIEDEVQIMVSDAMENLNVSDDIRAQIEAQITALSLEEQITQIIDQKIAELGTRDSGRGTGSGNVSQSPVPNPQSLTLSGTIRAQELYASTLALDETLSVGSDARIAGDLTVDGTLNLSHLFLTGLLTIDGELNVGSTLRTNTLVVETGATLGGPVTVLSGLKVATGATFELQNGSTLRAASGAMVDLGHLIVRDALQVMGDITIHGLATFLGDIEIRGQLTVSKNQAGTVVIPRGQTSVTVTFETPFTNKPVVTAASDAFTLWRVRNQTMSGFTIEISTVLEEDATFSWHALAVRGEESEGSEVSRSGSENVGIPFPVDQAGVPLSSNAVWNACIRNQITLDSEGNPMSCGRYHNEQDWEHPDLHITFIWNGSAEPAVLTLPEGYVATVISSDEGGTEGTEVTSSSSSSVSSESSSSLPTVAPAGAEVGESSDSSVSSESSSSSSSAETTISSSSSSSSQAPVASSSSSSVAPVVAPAPAPVTAPQDNGDGGFEGLFE